MVRIRQLHVHEINFLYFPSTPMQTNNTASVVQLRLNWKRSEKCYNWLSKLTIHHHRLTILATLAQLKRSFIQKTLAQFFLAFVARGRPCFPSEETKVERRIEREITRHDSCVHEMIQVFDGHVDIKSINFSRFRANLLMETKKKLSKEKKNFNTKAEHDYRCVRVYCFQHFKCMLPNADDRERLVVH